MKIGYPFYECGLQVSTLLLGPKIATKLHNILSTAVPHDGYIENKKLAAIDWEAWGKENNKYPYTAFDTWRMFYPDEDMEPTLRKLKLWPDTCKLSYQGFDKQNVPVSVVVDSMSRFLKIDDMEIERLIFNNQVSKNFENSIIRCRRVFPVEEAKQLSEYFNSLGIYIDWI